MTVTRVPGANCRSTSLSGCSSSIAWSLTLVTTSWALIPARSAGDPELTSVTSAPTTRLFAAAANSRSEEHTSELQSLTNLVCRLLLEKKKKKKKKQSKKHQTK